MSILDCYFGVTDSGLVPFNDESREALRSYGCGEIIRVKLFKDRNVRFHRKYWALVNMVFENQEIYKSKEAMHFAIKVAAGWIDHVEVGQKVHLMPRSTSFEKMSEQEFSIFYLDAVEAIKALIPQFGNELEGDLNAFA